MDKVIMHVDMDAFFAAVEVLDNPALRGKPVIVGGTSERGVVATCSYEARAYGVRSAMPIYMAKANCPHGVFLPTRYWRYKEISNKIFDIFYQVTDLVEGLSIDEAYLDITALYKNPIDVAVYIKNKVKRETGLTISVGISYNKFLAKLASDWNKPDGLKIITKDMIPKILYPLSVDKVYGLGKKSTKKLNDIGIFTIEDLYKLPRDLMIEFFGKFGSEIYDRIRGIDRREVTISRERKSIGKETTLLVDTDNKLELMEYLKIFSRAISNLLKNKNMSGNNITVKIKTSSFVSHTRSRTLQQYINDENDIFREAASILEDMKFEEKIRLIGLSVSNLKENKIEQLTLWR
ncbi:DNA polymerase IV [Clostridium thermarum]|uniref:DNA polymerase IV n=1 Tax=Clostridium thermarum TaxID=1716543 RepID=UPI001120E2DB|nr:DNA polymerase IV [Clostridium thermarum]